MCLKQKKNKMVNMKFLMAFLGRTLYAKEKTSLLKNEINLSLFYRIFHFLVFQNRRFSFCLYHIESFSRVPLYEMFFHTLVFLIDVFHLYWMLNKAILLKNLQYAYKKPTAS
jgi:hypothetical protein